MSKYLARSGWQVHVLTTGEHDAATVDGVQVHTVRRARTLNDAYQSWSARSARRNPNEPTSPSPAHHEDVVPSGRLRRLKAALAMAMRYPDYSRGWIFRAGMAARRIIRRQEIDVVVSSGPPHTAHLAAALGTVGLGVRWLMDMRDPWSGMIRRDLPAVLASTTRQLERVSFAKSDLIICNTRQFCEQLRAGTGRRVEWIPNGIDLEELPARAAPLPEPVTIVYVGTLYLGRDLGPILQALAQVAATESPDRGVRLKFAGHADPVHAATLQAQVERSGLGDDRVERLGHVSQDEARALIQSAHLALVLAQNQPMQVPAKLYEAVGLGVQTLVIAERDSAAASEAQRLGALWCEPDDVASIAAIFQALARGKLASTPEPLEPIHYRHLAERMSDLLMSELP